MSLELRVLSNSLLRQHPNIVRLLGASWEKLSIEHLEKEEGTLASEPPPPSFAPILLLEQASCTLKQLYDEIAHKARPKLSLSTKVSLWCDIANALSAVHLLGIIHGDIKPENILIFEDPASGQLVAKLSDFGGCQPLPDAGSTANVWRLLGTEYWNAPEVYDETDPYFRKPLRDYYSFGMMGAYMLFEEEPFGPPRERTAEQEANMRRSKENYHSIAWQLEMKVDKTHTFVATEDARQILASIPHSDDPLVRFKRRYSTFRALFEQNHIQPGDVVSRFPRTVEKVPSHDNRIFAMCFAILRFLHVDPEERQVDGLLGDLKKLIEDPNVGQTLAFAFGAKCWRELLDLALEAFNIWTISAARQEKMTNSDLRISMIEKVQTKLQPLNYVLSPDTSDRVPEILRTELVNELEKKVQTSIGTEKAEYLLSLGYWKVMRGEITGDEYLIFCTDAARLGSLTAKAIHNILDLTGPWEGRQPFEERERNTWLLEYLLFHSANLTAFIASLQETIPNLLSDTQPFEELRIELRLMFEKACVLPELDDSPFIAAARAIDEADISRLRRIIARHPDTLPNEKRDGHALLHCAARLGQHECALLLVRKYKVDIDLLTDDGMTALQLAAAGRQAETLNALINAGANVEYLFTPLTLRLVANDGLALTLVQIKRLFEQRADLWRNRPDRQQDHETSSVQGFLDCYIPAHIEDRPEPEHTLSPIFMAILGNNTPCLQALLWLGCSTTRYHKFESSVLAGPESVEYSLAPIHLAANHLGPWHLALLLYHGENAELQTDDDWKMVPLHFACVAYKRQIYKFPDAVTATSDLLSQFELEVPDVIKVRLLMIKILIKHGANVNSQDAIGRTALMFCVTMPHCLPVMQYLVNELGADIKIKDRLDQTCLHYAAGFAIDLEYAELCIAAGCDINARNIEGNTPLGTAERLNHEEYAQLLRKHGAEL